MKNAWYDDPPFCSRRIVVWYHLCKKTLIRKNKNSLLSRMPVTHPRTSGWSTWTYWANTRVVTASSSPSPLTLPNCLSSHLSPSIGIGARLGSENLRNVSGPNRDLWIGAATRQQRRRWPNSGRCPNCLSSSGPCLSVVVLSGFISGLPGFVHAGISPAWILLAGGRPRKAGWTVKEF